MEGDQEVAEANLLFGPRIFLLVHFLGEPLAGHTNEIL